MAITTSASSQSAPHLGHVRREADRAGVVGAAAARGPCIVVMTGAPSRSASPLTAPLAPERSAPPPAQMSGRSRAVDQLRGGVERRLAGGAIGSASATASGPAPSDRAPAGRSGSRGTRAGCGGAARRGARGSAPRAEVARARGSLHPRLHDRPEHRGLVGRLVQDAAIDARAAQRSSGCRWRSRAPASPTPTPRRWRRGCSPRPGRSWSSATPSAPGRPRVAVCRVDGGLLVADGDEPDRATRAAPSTAARLCTPGRPNATSTPAASRPRTSSSPRGRQGYAAALRSGSARGAASRTRRSSSRTSGSGAERERALARRRSCRRCGRCGPARGRSATTPTATRARARVACSQAETSPPTSPARW